MSKIKKFFTNGRIIIYLIFFVLTILAIHPAPFNKGVALRTVEFNSTAYLAGMQSPTSTDVPMSREVIVEINRRLVNNILDFETILASIPVNATVTMKTTKSKAGFLKDEQTYIFQYTGRDDLGLKVYDAPKSNIILGLDLQGGTRVVLQPEKKLPKEDLDFLLENMERRINLFGLSDTVIRTSSDLSGNQFIIVEIAGVNQEEVENLLAKQGKFEAKIGNETVFVGGKDIISVCKRAECAGVHNCQSHPDGTSCRFTFSITLSEEAAAHHANVTDRLEVIYGADGSAYLSESLDLYLDDSYISSLNIGAELKGNPVTGIAISGGEIGRTSQEAVINAQENMKEFQTLLITGSLPVKLDIIKSDTLSPQLGKEFLKNALLIAILAELAVTAIVIIRYRKVKIAIPIITVITTEILLILGIAALFRQNIDIAGIAGIIVAIGTGVDDQIVITDEILGGDDEEEDQFLTWAQKIKKAFFIVIAAYVATVAAMIPLYFAGAGLLRGFAVTTIIGVTNGVLITRPAFAKMMEILLSDEE